MPEVVIVPPSAPSWTDQVTAVLLNPVAVAMKDCDPPSRSVAADGTMVIDIGGGGGAAELLPPPHAVKRNAATRERENIRLEKPRCSCHCALIPRPRRWKSYPGLQHGHSHVGSSRSLLPSGRVGLRKRHAAKVPIRSPTCSPRTLDVRQ